MEQDNKNEKNLKSSIVEKEQRKPTGEPAVGVSAGRSDAIRHTQAEPRL